MTEENIEFVEWYRKFFKRDVDLPCLSCTDEKIVKCANAPYSCILFHNYAYKRERRKKVRRRISFMEESNISLDKLN